MGITLSDRGGAFDKIASDYVNHGFSLRCSQMKLWKAKQSLIAC